MALSEVRLRQPMKSDQIRTCAYIALTVLAVVGLAFGLGRERQMLALAGIALAIALLVLWHAATTGYRCPDCNHQFMISAWADFFSPHILTTKYVKCPACGRRAWMEALVREKP